METCVLFCCLGTTDRNETELHSRRRYSDSRTVAACDGRPDHVWTWIKVCKYFLESSWSLLSYASNLKSISCQSRPQSLFWCRDLFCQRCCDTLFWPIGPCIMLSPIRRVLGLEDDPASLRSSSHTYKTYPPSLETLGFC
jgi:hypothetical protein